MKKIVSARTLPRVRFAAAAAAVLVCGSPALGKDWSEVAIADAHVHLLDFLQNGDYLEDGKIVSKAVGQALRSGERGKRIEAILLAMDRANVSHALVTGMPFLKKWSENDTFRSGYYLDSSSRVVRARDTDYHIALAIEDYQRAGGKQAAKQLDRLFVCVSGFDGTDLGAVDMIAKRMKEFPGIFLCIGEVMSRHDDLTNLTTGERPRANHPSLMRVFDFSGKHGIPVSVHHNMAPVSPSGEIKEPLYLPELLDAFTAFPNTTFLWCHAGVSRRIHVPDLPGVIAGVLDAPWRPRADRSLLGRLPRLRAKRPAVLGIIDPQVSEKLRAGLGCGGSLRRLPGTDPDLRRTLRCAGRSQVGEGFGDGQLASDHAAPGDRARSRLPVSRKEVQRKGASAALRSFGPLLGLSNKLPGSAPDRDKFPRQSSDLTLC